MGVLSGILPDRLLTKTISKPNGGFEAMQIRPLYDRLVVRRIEPQETVMNGIIIPDTAKEKPQEGEVVAAGRGKRLEDGTVTALDVKVGDRILFGKYSGSDIKIDGEEYLILREDEVLGVLENGK
jgi:chaperonin GroES